MWPSAVTRQRSQSSQNGSVVDAMMPNTVPFGRRYRRAGADERSSTGTIGPKAAPRRSSISARETTWLHAQCVAPPTSMYSMKRTSAPTRSPNRIRSASSSSLVPRRTTVSILSRPKVVGGGGDALEDRGVIARARQRGEAVGVEGVEAHGDAVEARVPQRPRRLRQEDAVGGEREVGEARLAGERAHEVRQIAPQQRFAAGQPQLVGAEGQELIDQAADLLERQQVAPGQPDVVGFRHAVLAAEIAAVGHRQPEAAQRPAVKVRDGRHALDYGTTAGQSRHAHSAAARWAATERAVQATTTSFLARRVRHYCGSATRTA